MDLNSLDFVFWILIGLLAWFSTDIVICAFSAKLFAVCQISDVGAFNLVLKWLLLLQLEWISLSLDYDWILVIAGMRLLKSGLLILRIILYWRFLDDICRSSLSFSAGSVLERSSR